MDKVLIKKKDDLLQYLYLKDKKIILCFAKSGDITEEVIADDCFTDFDACYDEDGNKNVIYYNQENEIIFLTQKSSEWTKKVLYAYKDKKTHISNFNLLIKEKILHIFFAIHNSNNPHEVYLIHQKWDKSWSGSNIALIKNISFTPFYNLFLDEEGNIHLIYITKEKNKHQLYYACYIKDRWSQKSLIAEAESIFFPDVIVDSEKNVHILWVEEDIIQEIKYKKKTPGSWPKGSWSSSLTLAYSNNIKSCYFTVLENNLWCTYIQNNVFFTAMSSDNGTSWSKPFKIPPFPSDYTLFKLKNIKDNLKSNYSFINSEGDFIPSLQYKLTRKNGEKDSYFTFYIKEVQEYLNILIKKIENIKEEKRLLEEELTRKNSELTIKNRNITELQELVKQISEEKAKIALKADNYNTMVNSLLLENENLKKQIKDLQNKIILLSNKIEMLQNTSTIEKIKNIFKKPDQS
ncbi:hypothetical protein TKV_c15690 [Thermoanaerobacter kivui]|uniref:Uncharacterized protein n=1 Tax=Thermoanaerobacter kivui TaxID=2325 RepID=A0A097ASE6_THEKI|nr:hypothetical protein [Thermoanaerobacter kivui]AIS52734.1 hypothetical protein TKV_c15690 [Thermoanaerobacter kivui]